MTGEPFDERLRALEQLTTRIATLLEHMHEDLCEKVHRHDTLLYGNSHKGLKGRLESLETDQARRRTTELAAWSAVVGLALKTLWDVLLRGGR